MQSTAAKDKLVLYDYYIRERSKLLHIIIIITYINNNIILIIDKT